MGIASESTEQADGGTNQTLCLKSCLGNHCWTGQHESAMELLVLPRVCSSKAETTEEMAKPQIPLESCLQEEQLEQQNPFCKKAIPDAAEDKQLPRPLKKESEETCLQGALSMFVGAFLAVVDHSFCLNKLMTLVSVLKCCLERGGVMAQCLSDGHGRESCSVEHLPSLLFLYHLLKLVHQFLPIICTVYCVNPKNACSPSVLCLEGNLCSRRRGPGQIFSLLGFGMPEGMGYCHSSFSLWGKRFLILSCVTLQAHEGPSSFRDKKLAAFWS